MHKWASRNLLFAWHLRRKHAHLRGLTTLYSKQQADNATLYLAPCTIIIVQENAHCFTIITTTQDFLATRLMNYPGKRRGV